MADYVNPALCLRCGHTLRKSDESQAEITFFECRACGRRYSRKEGRELVFYWPHPIGIALYSYLFRSGSEEHHVSATIDALVDGRSSEEIIAIVNELELELELGQPTQSIHLILDGVQASELECRDFLRTVVGRLKLLLIALCESSGASPQAALCGMAAMVCGLRYDEDNRLMPVDVDAA